MIRFLIRFVLRWLIRGVFLAIILATALVLLRDVLLRELLRYRLERVTGLRVQLGALRTSWSDRSLALENLLVLNSEEFGGSPLLTAPELHLELDSAALPRGELRLRFVRVRIDEFSVVRNRRGETNLVALLGSVNANASAADAATVSPPGLEFTGIETLDLTFGTLHLIDLAQPANTRDLHVSLTNEILHEVKTAANFTPLVLRVLVREVSAGLRSGLAPPPRVEPRRP